MESGWSACSSHHQKLGGCQNLLETAKSLGIEIPTSPSSDDNLLQTIKQLQELEESVSTVTEELLIRRLDSEFGEHISGELIGKVTREATFVNKHAKRSFGENFTKFIALSCPTTTTIHR
eukprot:428_1